MNGEIMTGSWKIRWVKLKEGLKKETENNKRAEYMKKELRSNVYKNQEVECTECLNVISTRERRHSRISLSYRYRVQCDRDFSSKPGKTF